MADTGLSDAARGLGTSGGTSTAGLAPWAAPYITNYLGKAQALGEAPYQTYKGPLTAGPSELQNKAFQGIANLTMPTSTYTPVGGSFTDRSGGIGSPGFGGSGAKPGFDQAMASLRGQPMTPEMTTGAWFGPVGDAAQRSPGPGAVPAPEYDPSKLPMPVGVQKPLSIAEQYMNPYMEQVLNPQLQAMQRQADIQRNMLGAQAAKSGAFGGARSGLMGSQLNAELMRQQQQATGQAYQNAFQQAQQQYNTEQQRKIQEAQFGADYGLRNLAAQQNVLNQMAGLGQTQRDIAQQGITADIEEFNRQRDYPFKQAQFMRDMISGLPISSVTNQPSQLSGIASLIAAMGGVDKLLGATGQKDLGSLFENLFGISFGGNKAP